MNKVARSFIVVCVFGAGAGLFSLAMGLLASSAAGAAATDTIAVLTGASVPLAHLAAAGAVLALSISALRMIGDLRSRPRVQELRIRSYRESVDF